jgi:hypothetical protein
MSLEKLLGAQSRQSAKLFLQSSELGLPQPLTRRRVCTPSPQLGGRGTHRQHTRWRGRSWESPNSDGGTYTVVLFIHIYVLCSLGLSFVQFPKPNVCKVPASFFCRCRSYSPHSIHPFPPDEKWFFVISFSVHLPTCMAHSF